MLLGFLFGVAATHAFHSYERGDTGLAIGIVQVSTFEASHYFELTEETDQKAYCFRYETAKSFVDVIEQKIGHNEYKSKSSLEQAQNLVRNFRNLEGEGLKYECKSI